MLHIFIIWVIKEFKERDMEEFIEETKKLLFEKEERVNTD